MKRPPFVPDDFDEIISRIAAIPEPPRRREPKKYHPWMGRWVLWARRGNAWHVATHAATLGNGVVSTLACGGATTFGPEAGTYYWIWSTLNRPVCRKCAAILAKAGESGRIGREIGRVK